MLVEGNGVTLHVEPPFSSILVVCTDIQVRSTTQCFESQLSFVVCAAYTLHFLSPDTHEVC